VKKDQSMLSRTPKPGGRKKDAARYANFFRIGQNPFEFLLEFGQHDVRIHSRIYVSPQHAKMFADLLRETLDTYQSTFGAPTRVKSQSITNATVCGPVRSGTVRYGAIPTNTPEVNLRCVPVSPVTH